MTSFAALSNSLRALSPPNCCCAGQRVDQPAHGGGCLAELAAHSAERVRDLVGPVRQFVHVATARSETSDDASSSLDPTSPAWNDNLACSSDSRGSA